MARAGSIRASSKTGKLSNSFMTSSDAILDSDLTNPKTRRLMSLLGVKYLVDHPEWLDIGPTRNLPRLSEAEQRLVFTDRDWRIWEYLEAYPRTFLVGNYEVESDDQKTLDRLYSPGFDPRTTLLLSSPISQELNIAHDPKSMVEIESYTPMKIVFKTISVSDQLLFLSDTWFPGWKAKIEDGKRLPILVAFTALRAVPVPAGNHTVTMWYFPESFRNGLIISFIMIITIILFIRIIKLNNE